jgi:hypothetical protein
MELANPIAERARHERWTAGDMAAEQAPLAEETLADLLQE